MDKLDLSDEDMRRILTLGRRFLINEGTCPDDLKAALIERLSDEQPSLARKLTQMSNPQMMTLCRTLLIQQAYA